VLAAERQTDGLLLIHNDWETLCDVNYNIDREFVTAAKKIREF